MELAIAVASGRSGTPVGGYELFKCGPHIVKQRLRAPSGDSYEIVVRAADECGDKFDRCVGGHWKVSTIENEDRSLSVDGYTGLREFLEIAQSDPHGRLAQLFVCCE
jgi:hypothetical protein